MVTRNAKGSTKRGAVLGLVGAVALLGWSAGAVAQPSSDLPAGYVVLPKVIVHTTGGTPPVLPGDIATDTLIQMTNINTAAAINVDCWWVNANNRCGALTAQTCNTTADCSGALQCISHRCGGLSGPICDTTAQCPLGLQCLPSWSTDDFQITLTPGQPIAFIASQGLLPLPCDPLFPGPGCIGNASGGVKKVNEDPFRGELKCVQVDGDDDPVLQDDLKLEATIITTVAQDANPMTPLLPGPTTAAAYNGVGFRTLAGQSPPTQVPTDPLCLGDGLPPGTTPPSTDCNALYEPCPNVLILDNFFDGAQTEFGGVVDTELTLVPCSENLGDPSVSANFTVTAQMLIYNEFEQRTSSSAKVECFRSTRLSDIDTAPGPAGDRFSIFSAFVQGTISGQTRIRGVRGADGNAGYGIIGVATENWRGDPGSEIVYTDAFNLHHDGFRDTADAVYLELLP